MSAEATEAAWDQLTLSPSGVPAGASPYRRRRSGGAYPFLLPYFVPFLAFLVVPVVLVDLAQLQQGRAARLRPVRRPPELAGDLADTRADRLDQEHGDLRRRGDLPRVHARAVLALLLNRYRKGSNIFKLALYVPLLAPAVLVGLVWQFVANYDFGLFNLILTNLGIARMNIFGNGTYALLLIVAAEVWRGLGFWTLYFLASLQSVPEELLDAAKVDGAKGLRASGASRSRCCARCCCSRS